MKIIIVGANFNNKGAQSMLFTTVGTIRRNYPDAEIFFAHAHNTPVLNDNFSFKEIYYNKSWFKVSAGALRVIPFPQNVSWGSAEETVDVFEHADLLIDISGFALGSKWGFNGSFTYLNKIKLARLFKIPMILMPQSFGPFDFGVQQKFMDSEISGALSYPRKIFAREYDGFVSLRQKYNLKNIAVHPDIVLASENVNLADIYKNPPTISVPRILPAACVGVVPNLRGFDHGSPWQALQTYYEMISFLRKAGKVVYILRHSAEDVVPCTWLKRLFAEDEHVVFWKDNFSCFEYDEICRQFDFMIVGRFHGIVHAYRNNVPCLLMGWAIKYNELAKLMYQSQYLIDLAAPEVNLKEIFAALSDMDTNLALNKKILQRRLAQVQAGSSCFTEALEILKEAAAKEAAFEQVTGGRS